ncbi:MAG: tetratricopeptide repeat protein [Longimicrobiaceae bacterium]
MSETGAEHASDLYNDGVTAAQKGNEDKAVLLWEHALTEYPAPGLEAALRHNLMLLLTKDLRNLEPRTELNHEQADRLKRAEAHMIRLHDLCRGDESSGVMSELNPEAIAHFRQAINDVNLTMMMGRGFWILPDGETPHRIVDLGLILANTGHKDRAIKILREALPHIDPTQFPEHKHLAINAHIRLATMLNDAGRKEEAVAHAREALSAGLNPQVNDTWYTVANILIESTGEAGEENWRGKSSRNSGCFIATAAYGSADAVEVRVLRRYRDEVLLRTFAGRVFVRFYYTASPPVARLVEGFLPARNLVIRLLKPLVRMASRSTTG